MDEIISNTLLVKTLPLFSVIVLFLQTDPSWVKLLEGKHTYFLAINVVRTVLFSIFLNMDMHKLSYQNVIAK